MVLGKSNKKIDKIIKPMEMNFKASRLLKRAALPSSPAFLLFFIRLVLIEHLLCSRNAASFLGYNGKRKLRMLKKKTKTLMKLTVQWRMADTNHRVPQINVL